MFHEEVNTMKNVLIVWWTQEGVELRHLQVENITPALQACNNRFIKDFDAVIVSGFYL